MFQVDHRHKDAKIMPALQPNSSQESIYSVYILMTLMGNNYAVIKWYFGLHLDFILVKRQKVFVC